MRKLTLVSAALIVLPCISSAQETPTEIVKDLSEQTVSFLEDDTLQKQEIDRLLADVDVDGIARFALGKYSSQISADEYSAYESAFRNYLREQLRDHLVRFSGGEVEIDDANRRGNQSIIKTTLTKPDGDKLDVNWRLRKSEAGWEVIDVEAMNLWLAIEQRAQFQAGLDQSGGDISALVRQLESQS